LAEHIKLFSDFFAAQAIVGLGQALDKHQLKFDALPAFEFPGFRQFSRSPANIFSALLSAAKGHRCHLSSCRGHAPSRR
jgi:hypothetical protein